MGERPPLSLYPRSNRAAASRRLRGGWGGSREHGNSSQCPNGHTFKVKDKYAGKKGLCPHCEGQVIVVVPDALSLLDETDELQKDAIRHRQAAKHADAQRSSSAAPAPSSTTRTTSAPRPAPAAACWAPP